MNSGSTDGVSMSTSNFGRLCTVQELAQILQCPISTIYYWVSRNEIPYVKLGRHLRFIPEEVLDHFKKTTDERKPACFKPGFSLDVMASKRRSLKNEVSAESVHRRKGN
jgi:excisionase family DNA binding protein